MHHVLEVLLSIFHPRANSLSLTENPPGGAKVIMGKSFKMVIEGYMTHENVCMNFRNNFLMGTDIVQPIGNLQMAAILDIWVKK